jgi:hypothetical protein
VCPRCRQNAPLVYRGVTAYCTACGAPRIPLTGSSVELAGQPSKVGGTITRVLGWIILIGGLSLAIMTVGLLALLGAPGGAMLAVGLPMAAIAGVIGYLLLRGGKQLQKSGDDAEHATKTQAIFALANTRGGVLRAWDVAQALQVSAKEGDDLLTRLAKESSEHVSVDVDDDGNVLYRFTRVPSATTAPMAPNAPAPVPIAPGPRVRVPASVSAYGARVAEPPSPLEDEEPSEGEPARQRAR